MSVSEKNPWRRLSTEVVFENPWIQVSDDQVLNPAGNPSRYGRVHFKNRAIGILPVDENGDTYLVGQFRYTIDAYSWEIPEGGGAFGVAPLEEARRELREETGLEADSWEVLFEVDLSNSVTDESGVIFLARDLRQGVARPEETEILKLKKISLADAYTMVERGEIRDSMSITALLKARLLQIEGRLPGLRPKKS
jgi:8-oxo-dGTP pyrophosphatase MutT (NUDIX family)